MAKRGIIELRTRGKPPVRMEKGGFHRSLGIPQGVRIPKSLVQRILKAEVGDVVTNPTSIGKKRIKVTTKVKRQAVAGFKGILKTGRETAMRNRRRRKRK